MFTYILSKYLTFKLMFQVWDTRMKADKEIRKEA
jgi:hypothetical protein